ncbi:MAG: hypothetical protein EWV82_14115 [Microcystis aeruginosa Ma_AC_P_19900807_S299]|nr:MAG: hypothetical protein EWV82_14115 [Microcystis aeruginosa Ma_AC_P_19900807_S299]
MVYLQILCNLILIFAVFEPSKINYARGLNLIPDSCLGVSESRSLGVSTRKLILHDYLGQNQGISCFQVKTA